MSEPERERRSEDSAAFESEKARRVANVERNRSLTTAERGDLIRILSDLTYAEAVRIKDRALDLAMSGSSRAGGLTAAEDAEQGRIRRIQRIYELTGEQGLNDKDQNELKGLLRDEKRNQTPHSRLWICAACQKVKCGVDFRWTGREDDSDAEPARSTPLFG